MDDEIVKKSLKKVGKGAGLLIISATIGLFFALISRIILARYLSVNDYGLYTLTLAILFLVTNIGMLGLVTGTPRMIGYYRGKKNKKKLNNVIYYSIQAALISGIITSIIIFLLSDIISKNIFHESDLTLYLRIISITFPLLIIIHIFSGIFRGFDETKPKIIFEDLFQKGFRVIIFSILILINITLINVIYGYLFSTIITFILYSIWSYKKIDIFKVKFQRIKKIRKELLFFSLPLIIQGIAILILQETDIIMIGYFIDPEKVGLYGVSRLLSSNIYFILGAFGFIYVPIASKLFAEGKIENLKRVYAIITKWCFLITIPFFMIMFVFPEEIIDFLFGAKYIGGKYVFQILLLGFIVHVFFGQNFNTLVVIGKTKLLMIFSLTAAILNIFLNAILIPFYGISGAAIATAISYILLNLLVSSYIYNIRKISPISINYIKSILISIPVIIFIYILVIVIHITHSFLVLFISFCIFIIFYFGLLLITKSLDKEDISLLKSIEKKTGIKSKFLRNLIKKYI